MKDSASIRRMRLADLPRVMEIELESFTMPWSEATFRGLLRRSDADLFVAEVDGTLVGYAVFWAVLDEGELGNVSVTGDYRRRGIGATLVQTVLERAADRGVRDVYLEVRVSNSGAQELYNQFGFEQVGRRRNYYIQPVEDAFVMRKRLNTTPFARQEYC